MRKSLQLALVILTASGVLLQAQVIETLDKAYHDTVNEGRRGVHRTTKAVDKAVGDAAVATKKALKDTARANQKAAGDTSAAATKGIADTDKAIDKAVNDAAVATKKALHDSLRTGAKAEADIGKAAVKASRDVGNEIIRTPQNLERNRLAINRYVEAELAGTKDTLEDAEHRIRKGKIADAIWHLGTDPIKHTEENAAKLVQQASLVRVVGQIAATAYGGPGGAAAYAAWYTYRVTNNAEVALRVGLIVGATSAGFDAAAAMPSSTIPEATRQALITGAIGGVAVAASGGDEAAVREAFVLSAGMVLIQDGYESLTGHTMNGKASSGEAYCMSSEPGTPCSPPTAAYSFDKDGKLIRDNQGNPIVDIRKVDPLRPKVGRWASPEDTSFVSERSPFMTAISKIPGWNAMGLGHDSLVIAWNLSDLASIATIAPAIVVTYVGFGTPYYDLLRNTGIESAKETPSNPASSPAAAPSIPPAP
jgi:hypothetical protein